MRGFGLFAALAILAMLTFCFVGDANAQCGVSSGGCGVSAGGCGVSGSTFVSQGSGGCGVQSTQRTIRFQGPAIVPAPAPVNEISITPGTRDLKATVGRPTLKCDGSVDNHCAAVVRPRVVRPVAVAPVATKGYVYTERRTGLLGLRGKVATYQEFDNTRR